MRTIANLIGAVLVAIGTLILIGGLFSGGSPVAIISMAALFIAGGWALSDAASRRTCPTCSEKIKYKALKCKHCGSELAIP